MMRLLVRLLFLLSLVSLSEAFSASIQLREAAVSASSPVVYKTKEESPSAAPSTTTLTKNNKDGSTTDENSNSHDSLPPVIQNIADERRLYQMKVGKAMDVLRKDMQNILTKQPDYSIYTNNVSLVDPSGVQLTGLDKYKSALSFFQTFIGFWFRTERSGIQFRMVYDFARSSIRISWNAVLIPKVSLLGGVKPIYVDGISYYQLDRTSGLVQEHKIEKLMINNTPVVPPYAIWSLLQQDALRGLSGSPRGVPVGVTGALTNGFQ